MTRIALTIASLGLVLGGSVYAQPAPYPQPGYPAQPGYPPPAGYPAQPGYPPQPPPGAVYAAPGAVPPGQPYTGPDGLTYVSGSPVYFVGGVYQPLVFVAGLGWGYYAFGNRFFPAPGPLRARLERFYPSGRGYPGRYYGGRGFHDGGFHDGGFHDGGFHDHDAR